ncbi:kynurenine formamidase [Mesorhizobium sp. J18]|uniref:cyclase family protein n=1 Tax=Mesorhizobium sp. J18 TaxID=935263 RepID=UPI00119A8BEF|nr:cyclase family protein [Mesorhizobium sp. J18]TWG92808.1 kynurenine formamidase [Mesorhizobium sp. J18]
MKEGWNRWGEDDEAGALNTIRRGETKAAANLVSEGKVFSLGQMISPRLPIPGHRPGMMHFMGRDGGDYAAGRRRPGGFQFAEDTIVMPMHAGTHLDALCHCWYDDALYNGFAATEVRSDGAKRLGAEKLPAIATRGLLLDFVRINGAPLEDGYSIGVDLLREAIAASGANPGKGDCILLRTGWLERQEPGAAVDFNAEPGIDVEAATMLAEADVALIGADNYAIEVLPFPAGKIFPVHQRLMRDFGIPLLEGLVLAELAEARPGPFLFVTAPLRIVGATASPVNPVAIL